MPHPLQYVLWLLSVLLQGAAGVSLFVRGQNRRKYFALAMYMLSNAVLSAVAYGVSRTFGLQSEAYKAFYFLTGSTLVLTLFFAILSLYQLVFQEMRVSRYVSGGATLLLTLTVAFSYVTVQSNASHMTEFKFVNELSQNLYFVGVILAYLLWGAVMQLRETRLRILQFVFSLGIYFSILAASYAMVNLFPSSKSLADWVPQLASVFLAGSWTYTFWFVPEEARLATAKIAGQSVHGAHAQQT